jgi:hypothetical protein
MPLVEPGRKAPAFSLADQDGEAYRLEDYAGRYGAWQRKSLRGRTAAVLRAVEEA